MLPCLTGGKKPTDLVTDFIRLFATVPVMADQTAILPKKFNS
jgi:hypothetical protein